MASREFVFFIFLALAIYTPLQAFAQAQPANSLLRLSTDPSSHFSIVLESLQNQINYTFQSIGILRRAMTHASFSEESNKALTVLGANVIDASVALQSLNKDLDISSKALNLRLADMDSAESCAADGLQLGLHKVVRVSPKTDSSAPPVVCGAFRALIGAIAVDTGKSDVAGDVFWRIRPGHTGRALAL